MSQTTATKSLFQAGLNQIKHPYNNSNKHSCKTIW